MTFRTATFPVQLSRDIDPLILGARMAVADMIRTEARRSITGATDAGIDAFSQGQRLIFRWETAKQASRFLKGFPGALVRWCFRAEIEGREGSELRQNGYPEAEIGTVGSYRGGWLTQLPGGMWMVSAGGVRAVGTCEDPITLHEVYEVRLVAIAGAGYQAQVIMTSASDNRDEAEDPVDPVMEPEDA